jgi:4-amino-4-deoxy-L-arabinose transferase-like glycosyltransferase
VVAPLFVLGALTAEIEPLNGLGTQLAGLALIDLLIADPGSRANGSRRLLVIVCGIGIAIAALAKGPASAPVLGGVVIGACISMRSFRPLRDRALFGAVALAAIVLIPTYILLRLNNPPDGAVVQDFSEFTWSRARLIGTLMLAPNALASAFPLSLALCFPWGGDAQREALGGAADGLSLDRGFIIARSLGAAWFISVGILLVIGVSNPRYAAPAAVLLPPLVAYVARGLFGAAGRFEHSRRVFARCFLLGHAAVWPVLLLGLSLWWVPYDGEKPRHEEGRAAGSCIAGALPDGAQVWADDAIEARPDVLLYAEQEAARTGKTIEPRWMKAALRAAEVPGHGDPDHPVYLLLRQDKGSDEVARLRQTPGAPALEQIAGMPVGEYRLFLFRLE